MIRNAIGRSGLIGAVMVLAGCASTTPPSAPKDVTEARDVTEVVNLVKRELATYDRYRSEHPVSVKLSRCNKDTKSSDTMDLTVSNVYLTLSAVASRGGNTSLTVPVFPVNYDGTHSRFQAQTIKIPLNIMDAGSSDAGNDADGDHSIAEALENFRNEIFNVNHDDYPCLEVGDKDKNKIKFTLQFDVIKNQTTGVTSVQLANSKIGASPALIDEAHQTLEFDMELVGKGRYFSGLRSKKRGEFDMSLVGKGRSFSSSKNKKKVESEQSTHSPSSRKIKATSNKPAGKGDAE